jgi:hypothetical protein
MFWSGRRPAASEDTTLTKESEFFCTCNAAASDSAIGLEPVTTIASPSAASADGAACAMAATGEIASTAALHSMALRTKAREFVNRLCIYLPLNNRQTI